MRDEYLLNLLGFSSSSACWPSGAGCTRGFVAALSSIVEVLVMLPRSSKCSLVSKSGDESNEGTSKVSRLGEKLPRLRPPPRWSSELLNERLWPIRSGEECERPKAGPEGSGTAAGAIVNVGPFISWPNPVC